MSSPPDNTELLLAAAAGDRKAFDSLFAHVYEEMREAAHRRLMRQRTGDTLNTTALVHEAYLRLVDQSRARWQDRAHFLALASRAMRFVLVDHVRARTAQKRGGAGWDLPLSAADGLQIAAEERAMDLLVLDEALEQLAERSPRLARIVEHRFFGGLTHEEIAEVVGVSVPTVKRDWARARAWLFRTMRASEASPRTGPPTA